MQYISLQHYFSLTSNLSAKPFKLVLMGPDKTSNKYAHIHQRGLLIFFTPPHCICAYLLEDYSGPIITCLIRQYRSSTHGTHTPAFDTCRIETENSRAAAAAASRGVAEEVKAPIGFIEVSTVSIIIDLPVLLPLVIHVI